MRAGANPGATTKAIGRTTASYLKNLDTALRAEGFGGELMITTCSGGWPRVTAVYTRLRSSIDRCAAGTTVMTPSYSLPAFTEARIFVSGRAEDDDPADEQRQRHHRARELVDQL